MDLSQQEGSNMGGMTSWIAGGAIGGVLIGVVTSCWTKLKALLWRIFSLLISQIEIKDDETAKSILTYLLEHYKPSRFYDKTYGAAHEHKRDGRFGMIPYEFFGGKNIWFWRGWRFLVFDCQKSSSSNTQNNNPYGGYWGNNQNTQNNSKITLTFVRGTFNVENIIRKACEKQNEINWNVNKDTEQKRFFIKDIPSAKNADNQRRYSVGSGLAWYHDKRYRLIGCNPNELGRTSLSKKVKALDMLIYPERIKKLIREVQIWRNNRDWYIERGIPWKRGWILYGPPGTGKTVLVRAFAEDEDLPLFVFSLGEMTNEELKKSFEDMQLHVPCIALFEDFDNVFHGRKNIAGAGMNILNMLNGATTPLPQPANSPPGSPPADPAANQVSKIGMLTFDCLLNCIDGAQKTEGIFSVFTTNDITKIDPALGQPRTLPDGTLEFISSRPGRVDKAIELTYMESEDKIIMAERILGEYPEGLEIMHEFLQKYPDLSETPAQFQERCSQLALAYFWEEQNKKEGLIGGTNMTQELRKKLLTVHKVA